MKKSRYMTLLMSFALFLGTGCNKQEKDEPQITPIRHSIFVQSQADLKNETGTEPMKIGITKADGNAELTYILEVWSQETTPRCLLHKTTTGTLAQGAVFDLALIPGTYDFLFWADYNVGHYTTDNLKEVALVSTSYTPDSQHDAFAGALTNIEWGENTLLNATLTRPLALVQIFNTTALSSTLPVSVEYSGFYTQYNVLTGETSGRQETVNIVFPETTTGSDLVGEDFLFVPTDGSTAAISITVGTTTKTLSELPLQTNYRTNITTTF